ncbi:unnamed protein product [Bemisia tabaci]|uniref:beta-N-acetylhexosaminidase n=1 Tax=Bemisia tabaci TaxID=7038 RepID=A0A9P0AMM2_BEMTA|nr:unnamed protein product [Bemisia tabaci]
MRSRTRFRHLVVVLSVGTCVWILAFASTLYQEESDPQLEDSGKWYAWKRLSQLMTSDETANLSPNSPQVAQGVHAETLRVVHLDLKGAPPTISYLKEWLKLVARAGATALLIEYEDMFPFEGILRNVSATNAYTKTEILDLLQICDSLDMEVIPLIQTFGHMEYVLKLADFMNLREVQQYPEVICPSKAHSRQVIEEMVRQVMAVHRTARWIHIGCDEVYHLKICPVCTATDDTPSQIFEKHVINTASFIEMNYPGVKTLIWDDMMRHWLPGYFAISKLRYWVEPVVWVYGTDVAGSLPDWNWFWYAKTFPRIWVAGSFKGATGELAVLPNLTFHLENQLSWIRFLKTGFLVRDTKIVGLILTGWSRYDHFAGLCEILPPSIPSLVLNLVLISNCHKNSASVHETAEYRNLIAKRAMKLLQCALPADAANQLDTVRFDECSFLGHETYFTMQEYLEVASQVHGMFEDFTSKNAWLTAVNVREGFMSPFRVWTRLRFDEWTSANKRTAFLEKLVRSQLVSYFDVFTIEEWFQQRIKPLYDKLDEMKHLADTALRQTHWPRRPLVKRPFQD